MAVPKRKTSKSKKRMRRSHHALKSISTTTCPNCGAVKLPHRVCLECGYYKDKQIVKVSEDEE